MSDLKTRAVIVGALVDTIGTLIVGVLFDAVVTVTTGISTAEELAAAYTGSVALQAVQLGLGLAMTGVGAYVAAWLAHGAERPHAFAVGVISTVIGFVFVFSAPDASPFWVQAAGLLLTIPAAYVGGEVRLLVTGGTKPR